MSEIPKRKIIHLNAKGQIVLPKKMRAHFGMVADSLVSCETTADGILLRLVAAVPAKPKRS